MATAAAPRRSGLAQALKNVRASAASEKGVLSWLCTIDHKRIGVLYGITAFTMFVVAGSEALLIRTQLATPNGSVLDADQYTRLFTMHGVTMGFGVVMPLSAACLGWQCC